MAKKEVVVDLRVESGQAGKSLKDLKKEFKETEATLSSLVVGTKEYEAALRKLGSTKDEMGLLRDQINSFADDAGHINAVGNAAQGLAGGFSAATGAAALFGSESEELNKTLVKVQGAMLFQQGLASLANLGDSMKVLQGQLVKTAIGQKIVTAAQWLWNAAVSANPIGLLVIAVAALVAAFKVWQSSADDAALSQERLNELTAEAKVKIDAEIASIEKRNKVVTTALKFEIDLLKAKRASIEEIEKAETAAYEKRRLQLAFLKGFQGELNAEQSAELLALTNEKILRDTASTKRILDNIDLVAKKRKEDYAKRLADKIKSDEDLLKAHMDAYNKKADIENAAIDKKEADDLAGQEAWNILSDEIDQEVYDGKIQRIRDLEAEEKRAASEKTILRDKELEGVQASLQATKELTDIYFNHQLAQAHGNAKKENEIKKKQFKVNKAFAVTQIILNTVIGMTKAISSNAPPLSFVLAAITGIAGTVATAKALSVKFQGESGGGGGSASIPRISGSGGADISSPSNTNTLLNPDGTVKKLVDKTTPQIKAVVVETEMTGTQNRVASLEKAAKF